jgi:hypothetical protein
VHTSVGLLPDEELFGGGVDVHEEEQRKEEKNGRMKESWRMHFIVCLRLRLKKKYDLNWIDQN